MKFSKVFYVVLLSLSVILCLSSTFYLTLFSTTIYLSEFILFVYNSINFSLSFALIALGIIHASTFSKIGKSTLGIIIAIITTLTGFTLLIVVSYSLIMHIMGFSDAGVFITTTYYTLLYCLVGFSTISFIHFEDKYSNGKSKITS